MERTISHCSISILTLIEWIERERNANRLFVIYRSKNEITIIVGRDTEQRTYIFDFACKTITMRQRFKCVQRAQQNAYETERIHGIMDADVVSRSGCMVTKDAKRHFSQGSDQKLSFNNVADQLPCRILMKVCTARYI